MKDKHTINLILISSRWFNSFLPKIVHDEVILGSSVSPFLFPEFQVFSHYLIAKLLLNHRKASPCVFNLSFFLSSFYYRSSSWRLYMVVHLGFFSFFNCSSRFLLKLWPAKLYSKTNMVLNTFLFWGAQVFFILHSKVQFFLPYLLRWCYVTLGNFSSCFMIHKSSGMRYFKPIIFNSFMRSFATHQSLHWSYLGLYFT